MARMKTHTTWMLALGLAAVVAAPGCTVSETNAPDLTGPSALGQTATLTASPDLLVMDGGSTSQIGVLVQKYDGTPVAGFSFRLKASGGGGVLAATQATTGADGRAVVRYTAPVAAVGGPTRIETIEMIPIGTDHALSYLGTRAVDIKLIPPSPAS